MSLPIYVFVLSVLLVAIGLSVALILGEESERKHWMAAPSTLSLYTTEQVCRDYASDQVLNCGHCGACSNVHDLQIYQRTSATLTDVMTDCARSDLLFGQDALGCLLDQSKLSPECGKCWVNNYQCNRQNCIRTCIKHRIFPFLPSWNDWKSEPLDPCIACDEKLCGPIFVECAGSNRRRVGVVSDIERDRDLEICDKVDWEWVLRQKASVSGIDNHEQDIASEL